MGITQLVEFQSSKLAVAGSSPVSHSIFVVRVDNDIYAGLAQLVAQLTCNQWVSGSSPEAGTIFARVVELVDARDLKSLDRKVM